MFPSEEFDWDAGNRNKNWDKHGVSDKEAEQVFTNIPLVTGKDVKHSTAEKRYKCLGQTQQGRLLFVSFTIRNNKIRVISARDQDKKERSMYGKEIKKTS